MVSLHRSPNSNPLGHLNTCFLAILHKFICMGLHAATCLTVKQISSFPSAFLSFLRLPSGSKGFLRKQPLLRADFSKFFFSASPLVWLHHPSRLSGLRLGVISTEEKDGTRNF